MAEIKAVLFDLDGTILDTIGDLTDSLNHVLEQFSMKTYSETQTMRMVGNGLRKLIERAVPEDTSAEQTEEMYNCLLEYYGRNCRIKTRPYPGITEMLQAIKMRGIRTAVISNKADSAVKTLAQDLFEGCFDFALGATDEIPLKPDRAMIDIVLGQLSLKTEEAIYVGDSQVDIETARNAGMECISVTWGFRTRADLIEAGAKVLAESPKEILKYVEE